MATQQANQILTPNQPALGSPYCYEPSCESSRELRQAYDRVNIKKNGSRESTAQRLSPPRSG